MFFFDSKQPQLPDHPGVLPDVAQQACTLTVRFLVRAAAPHWHDVVKARRSRV
jgi:hypothetical protein